MRWRPPGWPKIELSTMARAFKEFRPVLQGQRGRLGLILITTVAIAGFELLRPWPIKLIFDLILIPVNPDQNSLGGLSPELSLVVLAAATLLISVLLGWLTVRATIMGAEVGRKATQRMRKRVFDHLHRLSFPYHQSQHSGDLLIRLMGDVNMVRDLLFASWINLIGRSTIFIGTAAVMFFLDPLLAALALLPVPVLGVFLNRSSRSLKQVTRKQRRNEGDAASFAAETLRQIRVVKAYAAEDAATEHFARWSRSGERAGVKAARISARVGSWTEVLTGAGLALVLMVGSTRALSGQVTPGELLVFMSYARGLYKPMRHVSKEGIRLAKATACAGRLLEVLEIPPEPDGSEAEAPRFTGDISFDNVGYNYVGGVEALQNVSFRVRAGDVAVIEGPNGSGKSTAVGLLLRFFAPDNGEVNIDGLPIDDFSLSSYRNRIAYVPQDIQLFGAGVRDNIAYGRPAASDEEIEESARVALFDKVVERLPDGYETVLGEGGATLSGGEARRLMLARAALRDADVLLLDEPLAGLDPEARRLVSRAIRRLVQGRTAVVINHGDFSDLEPDLVLNLENGVLVDDRRLRGSDLRAVEGAS